MSSEIKRTKFKRPKVFGSNVKERPIIMTAMDLFSHRVKKVPPEQTEWTALLD